MFEGNHLFTLPLGYPQRILKRQDRIALRSLLKGM
jgi:hypothetical protein